MDVHSTWGAMLVGWLLLAPLAAVVLSSRWGGGETAMSLRRHEDLRDDPRRPMDRDPRGYSQGAPRDRAPGTPPR